MTPEERTYPLVSITKTEQKRFFSELDTLLYNDYNEFSTFYTVFFVKTLIFIIFLKRYITLGYF